MIARPDEILSLVVTVVNELYRYIISEQKTGQLN